MNYESMGDYIAQLLKTHTADEIASNFTNALNEATAKAKREKEAAEAEAKAKAEREARLAEAAANLAKAVNEFGAIAGISAEDDLLSAEDVRAIMDEYLPLLKKMGKTAKDLEAKAKENLDIKVEDKPNGKKVTVKSKNLDWDDVRAAHEVDTIFNNFFKTFGL